jgi:hypothetical protein
MTLVSRHLCRHLRWKSQSRDDPDPRWIFESLDRGQVPFSCLHTCQPWGPDDDVVAPECCTTERPCYEPDPRLTSPRIS